MNLSDRVILHAIESGFTLEPWQFDALGKIYEEKPSARP